MNIFLTYRKLFDHISSTVVFHPTINITSFYAIGSLKIVPVLILVVADNFRSGNPSEATTGESLVLATVNVCSASSAK